MRVFEKAAAALLSLAILSFPSSYAFASTASANLPIQVKQPPAQGGIACDIGPNYQGSIPAGAQAAGMTHCAANYDFTSTTTFNNGVGGGSGYNFGNMSTWLHCAGVSSAAALWYPTDDPSGDNCPSDLSSQFQIANDTANGGAAQELLMGDSTNESPKIATASSQGWPTPNGALFPSGSFYEETVARLPTATQNNSCPNGGSTNCIIADSWSWETGAGGGVSEIDFIEMYGPASNVATNGAGTPFDGIAEPGHEPGYDPNAYNNYAMRVTVDSSGNAAICNYLNGSQMSDQSLPSCNTGGDSLFLQHDRFMILQVGPQGGYTPSVPQQFYVQRMTVWTLAGCDWRNSACTSSPDTGNP